MMHSGRQSGGPKVSWLMHGFARNVRPAEARSKTSLMCPLATSQHLGENQTDYPSLCLRSKLGCLGGSTSSRMGLVPSSCADQGLGCESQSYKLLKMRLAALRQGPLGPDGSGEGAWHG